MKRYVPVIAFALGLAALALLLPRFDDAQPKGVRLTRPESQIIADAQARDIGIPVDTTWSNITWSSSGIMEKELERRSDRERAWDDPVIAPRIGAYRVTYYRRGAEKFPPYGRVTISGRTGQVTGARMILRGEDGGGNPGQEDLQPRADRFVRSRAFRGAPHPKFESARPTVQRNRTDWVFRYRVETRYPIGKVVPYLNVYFGGDRFLGWELMEEYADGTPFAGDNGADIAMTFVRLALMFTTLLILMIIFLRKYHAGEVGVGSASFLFAFTLVIMIVALVITNRSASEGVGAGNVDGQLTSFIVAGFSFLFVYLPIAVLVFFAWAVGESYARERWGERLASFDAILRRDPLNATVGRSLLRGALFAPGVAAMAFLSAAIAVALGLAWPTIGSGSLRILYLGGPLAPVLNAMCDAIVYSIGAILFVLAYSHRRRLLWVGLIAATLLGTLGGIAGAPIEPVWMRVAFGFGGIVACIAIFLGYDLLATATAMFGGALLTAILPLARAADGRLAQDLIVTLAIPLAAIVAFAIAALMTRREVVYTYEDLAPHVKRIVERERVKAEIDAANRIQAALLPLEAPSLAGVSVSSHYRAATEIGGDYFDFLPQPTGEIGIAFGDVSGHGLTSGIVMAMAKAALLVQVDYDASPRAVLDVLNEIVIKTSPRRTLMTFFFGLLDPRTQLLLFSSAGHLDPYVYRSSGRIEPLSSWGYPLGIRRREPFREHTVAFNAGDRLVLYSDGLIEAVDDDGNPFGFERFERVLLEHGHENADEIKKALLNAVRKFTRNRPPEDDQTLVVVSFDESAAEATFEHGVIVTATATTETVH